MITGFYAMLFAFIFSEIYHFFNKKRLDLIFKNKDTKTIRKVDIVFYMSKLLSIFWPIVGLFSSFSHLFLLIIVMNLMKFVFYHLNDHIYKVYISALPWMNVVVYITILSFKFFIH
jgi:hypothetical protein